jgi:hypothetical protein
LKVKRCFCYRTVMETEAHKLGEAEEAIRKRLRGEYSRAWDQVDRG